MSDAPERIWAVTDSYDVSAQIEGDVYAQQTPGGMVGEPVEYVRSDIHAERLEAHGWQPIETAPQIERKGPSGLIIIGNQYWSRTVMFVKRGVISEPECGDLWATPDVDWTVPVDDCTATHWRANDIPALAQWGAGEEKG